MKVVTPSLAPFSTEVSGARNSSDVTSERSPSNEPVRNPRTVDEPPSRSRSYGGSVGALGRLRRDDLAPGTLDDTVEPGYRRKEDEGNDESRRYIGRRAKPGRLGRFEDLRRFRLELTDDPVRGSVTQRLWGGAE